MNAGRPIIFASAVHVEPSAQARHSPSRQPVLELEAQVLGALEIEPPGEKAPEAAGEIHTDLERGFIRAEVIEWDKMVEAGGWAAAKAKGWVRTEGKEYVMKDGDIMNVLHNM